MTATSGRERSEIAADGFLFGYPLVLMERTRAAFLRQPSPGGGRRRMNELVHARRLPDPSSTIVVRPNVDTLYSTAWLDLSAGPVRLETPPANGRYWLLTLLSAWTDVLASLGPRTSGGEAGRLAVVGPGFDGTVPAGMDALASPTTLVWVIGRTRVHGPEDLPGARRFQDSIRLLPGAPPPPPNPVSEPAGASRVTPPVEVESMAAASFFGLLADLLVANPPAAGDKPMMDRLAQIGLEPGRFTPDHQTIAALEVGFQTGVRRFRQQQARARPEPGGWSAPAGLGGFDADYRRRAGVARSGLGANLPADTLYFRAATDERGEPLSGGHSYIVHFERGRLPPARAFWSIALYDERGYLVENPVGRHAIGAGDALTPNGDDSLDLVLARQPPSDPSQTSNWLPAPPGRFEVVLRLYWPADDALTGTWAPPPIQKR